MPPGGCRRHVGAVLAARLASFRFTWKQKTHSPELVEGRVSPPMPCFDGAQHWVVAADRALRRVGNALGIRAHRLSAARALLIGAAIFFPGLALASFVAQAQ